MSPTKTEDAAERWVRLFLSSENIRRHPLVADWRTWGPVVFEVKAFDGRVRLNWIQVVDAYTRQGWARRFMEMLCLWADLRGLTLELEAQPVGVPSVPEKVLVKFYKSLGFRPIRDRWRAEYPTMRREPLSRKGVK